MSPRPLPKTKVHELDADAVRATWERVKPDIIDRMDFCQRMARRFVNEKNRREVAVGTRERVEMDDHLVIMDQVREALPELSRGNSIATRVMIRSVSRDAVRRSARPKTKPATRAINDANYAKLDAANASQKALAQGRSELALRMLSSDEARDMPPIE